MKKEVFCSSEVEKLFRKKIFDPPFIPTIPYIIRLLRERYHIHIGVYNKEYYIKKGISRINNGVFMGGSGYKSNVDALNAALKYSLENLI